MRRYIIAFFIASTVLVACNTGSSEYKLETFTTSDGRYGYDIYHDTSLVIHQPVIPAAQGNVAFENKNDAEKVGELVIQKLEHKVMPPSVTTDELDSLGIDSK